MFISPAYAQQAAPGGGGLDFTFLLVMVAIFGIMYFFTIRPQQKRMQEHQQMLASIRRGDEIVTGGGVLGKVIKANDDDLTVEIAPDVRVKVLRAMVSQVRTKTQPVQEQD